MSFKLGKRSRAALAGVHPDLVAVVELAILLTPIDFVVLEGVRTLARQQELYAQGATRTLRSRHLTGHAVDIGALYEGKLTWRPEVYRNLAPYIKDAARRLGTPIAWGGDWKKFIDMPHWQLPE
jgi:peptidoglycan L-alanyl-D-glutamate endopeptidase CwlK